MKEKPNALPPDLKVDDWRNWNFDGVLDPEQMACCLWEYAREGASEPLTDKLAPWLVARYFVAAKALAAENGQVDWKLLRELCNDVVALRRGDHYAERLRIERQRLEHEWARGREQSEAELWEWVRKPENRDRICQEFKREAEESEAQVRALLGDDLFEITKSWAKHPRHGPDTSGEDPSQPPPAESDSVRLNPTESNQNQTG